MLKEVRVRLGREEAHQRLEVSKAAPLPRSGIFQAKAPHSRCPGGGATFLPGSQHVNAIGWLFVNRFHNKPIRFAFMGSGEPFLFVD